MPVVAPKKCFGIVLPLLLLAGGVQGQIPVDPQVLWADVTLYRDEWGTPHIYAHTPRALGFAFGYAQAEDHLDAMLLSYRVVAGRAAEVLGEPYARSDEFAIKMGHERLAAAAFANIDPVTAELCAGFAQGVNLWLVEHPGESPDWAEGIQPHEVLALWHAFLVSMAPLDLPEIYRRPRAFDTGNAWALAPWRTEEGKTILVINPHQYYDIPFQWYEAHLALEDYNVAGATLIGLPIILQGHNGVMGWALTPNHPDFADVFEEHIQYAAQENPKNLQQPLFSQEQLLMLEYMSRAQPYYVRTAAGLEERFAPTLTTERGPVFEQNGRLYSWRIGGYRAFGGLYQLFEMGRAPGLAAFQQALYLQQIPCFHVLYADREGNLFYLYNTSAGVRAQLPHLPGDRPQPFPLIEEEGAEALPPPPQLDWRIPQPAAFDMAAWSALLPVDALPFVLNPRGGYLQICGNPPWGVTDDLVPSAGAFPPWLVHDSDTFRARRVRQLLRSGPRSFRDNHAMIYDMVAPAAAEMVPRLLDMAEQRPELVASSHPDLKEGLELLRDWSHVADPASPGMTFFHVWWSMLRAQNGPDPALYNMIFENSPGAQERALSAAADAARMMRNEFQAISIPWGDVHRIHRGLRDESMPGANAGEPLFIAGSSVFENGQWRATYGYGYALAVQFGETPEAFSISPFGASGRLASPHFADQLDLFLEQRLKRYRFIEDDVWRYASSARGRRITLLPMGVSAVFSFTAGRDIQARLNARSAPPADPPPGYAAFSRSVTPEWAPAMMPVELMLEFYVPPSVCLPENFSSVGLFAHIEGMGWQLIEGQMHNPETLTISAMHDGHAAYVLLGPANVLVAPMSAPALPPRPPAKPVEVAPEPEMPAPEDTSAQGPEVQPGPALGAPGGIFKIERSDSVDESKTVYSLPKLPPGQLFGPAARQYGGAQVPPEDRLFKEQRLDEKTLETDTDPAEKTPQILPPGNAIDTPGPMMKIERHEEAAPPQRGRSTLPSRLPPGQLFGPAAAGRNKAPDSEATEGKMKIERLEE